jgi:hypothetical protein
MRSTNKILLASVLMLACSGQPDVPPTEVSTSVGHTIDVTLKTFGEGRFLDPVLSSPVVVRLLESGTVPSQGTETLRQVFRFEALAKGRAEIHFDHTRLHDALVDIVVSD